MASSFTELEQSFLTLKRQVDSSVSTDPDKGANDREKLLNLLEQMEAASAEEPRSRAKVRLYRHQIQNQIQNQNQAPPVGSAADEQARRHRLLDHTARLDASNQRLRDSHRVALESETMGADILSQLRGQRETLEATRDTLGDTDSSLDRAAKMLKSMSRRFF